MGVAISYEVCATLKTTLNIKTCTLPSLYLNGTLDRGLHTQRGVFVDDVASESSLSQPPFYSKFTSYVIYVGKKEMDPFCFFKKLNTKKQRTMSASPMAWTVNTSIILCYFTPLAPSYLRTFTTFICKIKNGDCDVTLTMCRPQNSHYRTPASRKQHEKR